MDPGCIAAAPCPVELVAAAGRLDIHSLPHDVESRFTPYLEVLIERISPDTAPCCLRLGVIRRTPHRKAQIVDTLGKALHLLPRQLLAGHAVHHIAYAA